MVQEIKNQGIVEQQINISSLTGDLNAVSKTRWQKRFEKLQEEVRNDTRYDAFIEEFKTYNTVLDGLGLEKKLQDAGFSNNEIIRAMRFKEKYSKRVILGEMYQAQQEIDVEIFSLIDNNFETYVFPKIKIGLEKSLILECLMEKVIQPILDILNKEGEADDFLNYNGNDIFGMVYFLTGKCHLNWKDYDSL